MLREYIPVSATPEDYEIGIDTDNLDKNLLEFIEERKRTFTEEWIFHTIFEIPKKSPEFKKISKQLRSEFNTRLIRLLAVDILEPGIDYMDTEFPIEYEKYDYAKNNYTFIPKS